MKIKLIPAKTKWGKKMEKICPKKLMMIYAQLLLGINQ
jgi:hypothetical protein